MGKIDKEFKALQKLEEKIQIKKSLMIQNGLSSNKPEDILSAQRILQNIEERKSSAKKSYLLDPLDFNGNFGYKDKPFMLTYNTLKSMSKVPIINSIIKTRKNQIGDFAEPQQDKYSTGFKIRRKLRPGEKERENSIEDWRKIEKIEKFILNCGRGNSWENDDFESFIRKIVEDSLTYDQFTFEITRDRKGNLFEFFATDASTYRVAESYDDDNYVGNKPKLKGYYPKYVQIYQGEIKSDFYPWELCFGIRNPSTSIYNNGYGISEIEELISIITSILWAEDYNKKFFSQGSAPKGLLKVSGNVNPKHLDAFRQEWASTVTGVQNAWKTPVVEGDVQWIDLQKSNRDMEYQSWLDFLIKVSCAVFSIDPNEIGFDISKSSGEKSLFDSNNEGRLKHSKDKGLYPLLKFMQRKINKFIVEQIDPEFEFVFMGLNGLSIQDELEMEVKKLTNFQTLNETRAKYNMDPVEGGDVILNPTYTQNLMMSKQNSMMGGGDFMGDFSEGDNPFIEDENDNPFILDLNDESETNPFLKSFLSNLQK